MTHFSRYVLVCVILAEQRRVLVFRLGYFYLGFSERSTNLAQQERVLGFQKVKFPEAELVGDVLKVFSFRAAFVTEKVCGRGNSNREKRHYSSQEREGSRVHPGPRNRGKSLRPDRRITERIVRPCASRRCRGPRSKTTENAPSNQ